MSDSSEKQIVNGVRIAAMVFATVLGAFVLIDGIGRVAPSVQSQTLSSDLAAGLCELLGVGVILMTTVGRWAKWVAPVAALGAVKSLIGLIAGTSAAAPFRPVPRVIAGETLAFFLVVAVLTTRFSWSAPALSEKIALVIVLFVACLDMLFEPQPIFLGLGCVFLLVTRLVHECRERGV